MSRENRVLKRASRALMPPIPELSEDPAALTSDPDAEPTVNCETLSGSEESGGDDEQLLLESQAKIAGQRKTGETSGRRRMDECTGAPKGASLCDG